MLPHRALRSLVLLLAAAWVLSAWPGVARAEGGAGTALCPMELMKSRTGELRKLLDTSAGDVRTRKVKALADSLIDYSELARGSLGKKLWAARSEAGRGRFTELLQGIIEKTYVEQTEKNPEFKVKWIEEELGRKGDRARVLSLASAKGTEVELEYRLLLGPGGWIVYNLLVDGVSMTRNYRKTFKRIIKKQGWEGLIRRMERKLAGERDEELERGAATGGARSKPVAPSGGK